MAEASAVAAVAVPGVLGLGGAAMLPGVDLNAVIGAMAGALFFVVWVQDLSKLGRFGYFVVSWIGGYLAASEAVARGLTLFSGLPALLFAALIVTVLISVIEWVKTGQMPGWIKTGWELIRSIRFGDSNG